MELKYKKLFLLDMDGTIYLGDKLFDRTIDFLDHIKKVGGRYIFLTNNSSRSVNEYVEKLKSLGISAKADDFFTSTDATILFLKPKNYRKIYALGTTSFKEQLSNAGLNIIDRYEKNIDCLLIGFDTELTFQKIVDVCKILNSDVEYIATNPDLVCPTEYGYVPDCGSVSEMICNATKKKPKFIGKPEADMINYAVEKSGFTKEETVIIGDRLYTDIAGGINASISTIFVLSGEGTKGDIEKMNIKPEYIYQDIREIYNELRG